MPADVSYPLAKNEFCAFRYFTGKLYDVGMKQESMNRWHSALLEKDGAQYSLLYLKSGHD